MRIPNRQAKLNALMASQFTKEARQAEVNGPQRRKVVALADDEIIANLRKAKNSSKFERLFDHGDTGEYGQDDSRADLALQGMLAFYSQDPEQLDRLFRRSALCRDKWLKRSDYRRRTIDAAINGLRDTYRASSSPSAYRGDGDDDGTAALAVKSFRALPRGDGPREFRVQNIVPERFVTTIYGEGGTGKSIIALSIALACARGDEGWLGLGLKSSPALYVDWELDEEEQGRRARQLAHALGDTEPPDDLYYLRAAGHASREVLPAALTACKEYGIGLVVIDSVGLAIEGDSAASQDAIRFFRQLDRFRAEGITVLLIDHQAKVGNGESYQNKTAFGSVYKGLLSRSRLQVETKERGSHGLQVVVRQNKANFSGHCQPFKVRIVFGEDNIALERQQLAEEELIEERVLNTTDRTLLALSDGPAIPEGLAETIGVATGTVQNALTGLKRSGLVEPTGEPKGKAREVRLTEEGKRYLSEYLSGHHTASSSSPTHKEDDDDDKTED